MSKALRPPAASSPPSQSAQGPQLHAQSTLLLLVSLVFPEREAVCVRLQLTFLSLLSLLPLTRRPLRASLAPPTQTCPPSSPLDCSSLSPLPSFFSSPSPAISPWWKRD